MTNTRTEGRDPIDVHDMVVVHRVFRRELGLLVDLFLQAPPGDLDRAAVLGAHARLILRGLHLHHSGEDEHLWPHLVERAAPSTDVISRMLAQHAAVQTSIEQLDPVLARWEAEARPAVGREAATLFERLRDDVIAHLDDEERFILPIAAHALTVEEWSQMGAAGVAEMTRSELPLMFGAVLEEATSTERREMLQVLPTPVRVLMRVWGAPHYRRYITRVRASQ